MVSRKICIVSVGRGKELCSALDGLLNELKVTISKAFEQSQYEDAKAQYVKEFQEKAGAIMDELKSWAAERHFCSRRPTRASSHRHSRTGSSSCGSRCVPHSP